MLSVSMVESFKDFDGDSSIRWMFKCFNIVWINNIAELPWKYILYTPELSCRKVLEMCCFMQNFLARTLADFEMNLEKEVLVPLNKLSEVFFCLGTKLYELKQAVFMTNLWPMLSMQEDLPEILKNKKQFAKLTTDWNNARVRWFLFCLVKICFNFSFNVNHTFIYLRFSFMKIVSWTFMRSVSPL